MLSFIKDCNYKFVNICGIRKLWKNMDNNLLDERLICDDIKSLIQKDISLRLVEQHFDMDAAFATEKKDRVQQIS